MQFCSGKPRHWHGVTQSCNGGRCPDYTLAIIQERYDRVTVLAMHGSFLLRPYARKAYTAAQRDLKRLMAL